MPPSDILLSFPYYISTTCSDLSSIKNSLSFLTENVRQLLTYWYNYKAGSCLLTTACPEIRSELIYFCCDFLQCKDSDESSLVCSCYFITICICTFRSSGFKSRSGARSNTGLPSMLKCTLCIPSQRKVLSIAVSP